MRAASGRQTETKSPPGPNLQSGSAFVSISAIACRLVMFSGNISADIRSKVSIGNAGGITQTKTEQKPGNLKSFSAPSFSLVILPTIWD